MRLNDKVILITGASSGLGEAIARACLAEGAKIIGCGLEESMSIEHPNAEYHCVNLTDLAQVQNMVKTVIAKYEKLSAVVNSAGICSIGTLEETAPETMLREYNVNVVGTFNVCKAAQPHLMKEKDAAIVNVGSDLGVRPIPGRIAYSPSKAAVLMLTKCLAAELAPEVRVNAINPGLVETPMVTKRFESQDEIEAFRQEMSQIYPLKRLGATDDIANAAVYLLSSESGFITGSALDVCGGSLI